MHGVDAKALNARLVKALAAALGFDACGIAAARRLDDDARKLEGWLAAGRHAGMAWMEKHFEERVDPARLVPGAKSVITLLMHYYPPEQQEPHTPHIAKYAWGQDYHDIIRPKLNELLAQLREKIGDIQGRGFVDSAPVLERAWARESGLGWTGKNANLLTRHAGSFFFIATLITDLELEPDAPYAADYCGTCTRCMEACPTDAIVAQGVVDSRRCLSYLTIELKEAIIPADLSSKMEGWVFGCDICQDVCPWNRFAKARTEPALAPYPAVLNLSVGEWEALDEEAFRTLLRGSPIRRAKWKGVQRNLHAAYPDSRAGRALRLDNVAHRDQYDEGQQEEKPR